MSVYRQSYQCGERSNAAFGKQSAVQLPSLAPHDSKARLISVTIRRRFMAKPCTPHPIAQRVQLFKPQTGNVGGRGDLPSRSLGGLRGPFSHVREWPPYPRPLHGAGKNAPCEYAGNNTTQCVKTMLTGSFQAIPQTRPARAAGRYASATACCSRGKTPPPM